MTHHAYTPIYLPTKDTPLFDESDTPKLPPNASWFKRLIAKSAYDWVLIACLVCVLVHSTYLPLWLTLLGVFSIIAQQKSIRHHKLLKNNALRLFKIGQLGVFFVGLVGIFLQFERLFSLDVSISFLVLCLIGKVWEMNLRRDAYIMLNINLFVLAVAFLWTQDVLMALAVSVGVLATLFGFVALNDIGNQAGAGRIKSLAHIGVPALPLLVVLFLFFPRISPIWNMPMASNQATTGMSDSMSPGDFSNLSKSTELAFRVEFDGTIPARNELYWRAMVFSDFDGITWRASPIRPAIWRSFDKTPDWATGLANTKNAKNYRILLQANNQHWLASLEHSRLTPTRGLMMNDEYTARSFAPISQQFDYKMQYLPNASFTNELTHHQRQTNLALPQNGNPKSHAFAKELMNRVGGNPAQFIAQLENHIQKNNFRYTLSPPLLNDNRIDEFLFGTQAGFCEHYASSFVFLTRAAGIPSRVVVGYQGGELGRDGQSWEVRQMDAHAWAEVWLENQGWVRIDPTGFIAPERVENGMDALTNLAGTQMFGDGVAGTIGYQKFKLLQNFRRYSDQASYYWQKNIVGFDQKNQQSTLLMLFNIKNLAEQLAYLMGAFLSLTGLLMVYFWHKRRVVLHPLDIPFVKLSHQLAKHNPTLAMATHEPVIGYLQRLGSTHQNDELLQLTNTLAKQYRNARFGNTAIDPHKLSKECKQLGKLLMLTKAKS